jgi:hypothetical protein
MAEIWRIPQGHTLEKDITLQAEATGDAVTGYTGAETLTLKIWPGGEHPARTVSGSTGLAWVTPPSLIRATIHYTDTATWDPGPVRLAGTLTSGGRPVPIFLEPVLLLIDAAPGAVVADATYTTWPDLLRVAPWIFGLINDDPTLSADLAEYQRRARTTIDDEIVASNIESRRNRGGESLLDRTWGGSLASDDWLRTILDDDGLIITGSQGEKVREIAARLAVAYACESQIGQDQGKTSYQEIATEYAKRARAMMAGMVALIDTNADGNPDLRILLGQRSWR